MAADANRRGTEYSPEQLSPEALRGLIEEFVTRNGTAHVAHPAHAGGAPPPFFPRRLIFLGRGCPRSRLFACPQRHLRDDSCTVAI